MKYALIHHIIPWLTCWLAGLFLAWLVLSPLLLK